MVFFLTPQISRRVLYINCGTSLANSAKGNEFRSGIGNLTLKRGASLLFKVIHFFLSDAKGSFRVSFFLNAAGGGGELSMSIKSLGVAECVFRRLSLKIGGRAAVPLL